MGVDFSSLKKAKGNLSSLASKIKETQQKQNYEEDDRLWSLTKDKAGNGFAIIRFLPAPQNEDFPWVKIYNHTFNYIYGDKKRWYIEKSRTTLSNDEPDPVYEMNGVLYKTPGDAPFKELKATQYKSDVIINTAEEQAKHQGRKTSYYSNIYVVKDPSCPENEGRVFLFKYGKKVFDKISEALNPMETSGEEPVNIFDFWEGANFKYKAKVVDGQLSYDSSVFESPSVLKDDDDELEKIWKQQYSLSDLISPDKFKSYDDLKKKLNWVLNLDSPAKKATASEEIEENDQEFKEPEKKSTDRFKNKEPESKTKETDDTPVDVSNDEPVDVSDDNIPVDVSNDIDDYFASLE